MHVVQIETQRGAPVQAIAVGRVDTAAYLLAVVSITMQLGVGQTDVHVKGSIDLTSCHMVLEEAKGASFTTHLDQAGIVAGFGHQIDSATQGVGTETESIGRLIDLDVFGGEQFECLEIAEAIGVTIREAIEQYI